MTCKKFIALTFQKPSKGYSIKLVTSNGKHKDISHSIKMKENSAKEIQTTIEWNPYIVLDYKSNFG